MPTLEFINNKFNCDLKRKNIQYILDFVLVWNLFELRYFDKFFKSSKIENFENNYGSFISRESLDKIFDYFKNRYSDNQKFNYLNIKDSEKELIRNNLKNSENKLYTTIFIIARYRNNLFHGEKNVKFMEGQEENFKITVKFLTKILENID